MYNNSNCNVYVCFIKVEIFNKFFIGKINSILTITNNPKNIIFIVLKNDNNIIFSETEIEYYNKNIKLIIKNGTTVFDSLNSAAHYVNLLKGVKNESSTTNGFII